MADNCAVVTEFIEVVWNQGRTDEAPRFLAADLAQHNPRLPDGREPLVGFIDGVRAQWPEAHFAVRRLAADGDLVFVHGRFTVNGSDPGVVVVDVFRVDGGVIIEHWDVAAPISANPTQSGRPVV